MSACVNEDCLRYFRIAGGRRAGVLEVTVDVWGVGYAVAAREGLNRCK